MRCGAACATGDSKRARSMKALVTGCQARSSSTAAAESTIAARIVPAIHLKRRFVLCGIYTSHGDDERIFERRVLVLFARAGAHARNRVDYIEALGDAAEHRVAVLALRMIEEGIVGQVYEELRGCTVDVIGARHRQRAALVLQAVSGFVGDWSACFLGAKVRRQTTAL